MDNVNFREMVNALIEQKLLFTHTAYVGKVTAINRGRCTLQPLTYVKDVHGNAHPQPLVVDAPKIRGLEVQTGDVVLCVVCERDISHAVHGQLTMPAVRRHNLADSVVVGVMGDAGF